MHQDQFLTVIDRDEAEQRFRAALDLRPLSAEHIPLSAALGRVLAEDVVAPVDVPGFDRANVDGFAVRSEDTFGAAEDRPCSLRINSKQLAPGMAPAQTVASGTATVIATGAMVPRGADAVVMVEYTEVCGDEVVVQRPATPGSNISFAGTDIGCGETVLRHGEWLTSRETGVLAALGIATLSVIRAPRVAILSTGNELVEPGAVLAPGQIFDSNATILADAVRELGGVPIPLGIVADERPSLEAMLRRALECDVVLLSGGTSKGAGDISYRVVADLGPPGIVAHGVALKPGKPLCLAAVRQQGRTVPVVVLPGFPTSAIFTFHEFAAPVLRCLAGRREKTTKPLAARLPVRVNSERGRTEYLLVNLVRDAAGGGLVAYPMGKGSGSVTAFSRADGFVIIPRQREYLDAGCTVDVQPLGQGLEPVDLVVIGSQCVGLDHLLGRLQDKGFRSKFLAVGSSGGLEAARRGECDLAGIHLLDPKTGTYNSPFLTADLALLPGYGRLQGIVFRRGDPRFENCPSAEAVRRALADAECVLVNRNRGSGTRVLIDRLLGNARPPGFLIEAKSHNAVVAAVAQGRADWGVAIETAALAAHLGFLPLQDERYDFVVPRSRLDRPAVWAFQQLLKSEETGRLLTELGFHTAP